jgi:uracil-DNA glycosylase
MSGAFESFVHKLAGTTLGKNAFNQYYLTGERKTKAANQVRRQNLSLYLNQMAEFKPELLLVGEAAGYRGCRRTGVPFTSEPLLLNGVEPAAFITVHSEGIAAGLFGQHKGYRQAPDSSQTRGEATATMVWRELAWHWPPPLLWNAFPFHPYLPAYPDSNRAPRSSELALGLPFLLDLAALFDITRIVAVGQAAARVLERAGIDGPTLRHPSHGGKRDFAEGLRTMTRPLDDLHYTSAHASAID